MIGGILYLSGALLMFATICYAEATGRRKFDLAFYAALPSVVIWPVAWLIALLVFNTLRRYDRIFS